MWAGTLGLFGDAGSREDGDTHTLRSLCLLSLFSVSLRLCASAAVSVMAGFTKRRGFSWPSRWFWRVQLWGMSCQRVSANCGDYAVWTWGSDAASPRLLSRLAWALADTKVSLKWFSNSFGSGTCS